jgi:hypothetical protein
VITDALELKNSTRHAIVLLSVTGSDPPAAVQEATRQQMSKFIAGLQRSLKLKLKRAFFDGGANRQLQEQIDIHR